jgi:hypothetical protein
MWVGDLRGDGHERLVALRGDSANFVDVVDVGAAVRIDGWPRSSQPAGTYFSDLYVGPLDANQGNAIVAAGRRDGHSLVRAMDAASLALRWEYLDGNGVDGERISRIAPLPEGDGVAVVVHDSKDRMRVRGIDGAWGYPRWSTVSIAHDTTLGLISGDLTGSGTGEIALIATSGLWAYDIDGGFSWSKQLAHWHGAFDRERREYLAILDPGAGRVLDLSTQQAGESFPLSPLPPASLLAIEPGWVFTRRGDGWLQVIDTVVGEAIDTGVRVGRMMSGTAAAVLAPSRYRFEQRLFLATGYGFDELRVLGSDHVFGGSVGGFEGR